MFLMERESSGMIAVTAGRYVVQRRLQQVDILFLGNVTLVGIQTTQTFLENNPGHETSWFTGRNM